MSIPFDNITEVWNDCIRGKLLKLSQKGSGKSFLFYFYVFKGHCYQKIF